MEKFFLRRRVITIENWQIGLLVIITVVTLIGFGALVEFAATDRDRAPAIARLALETARIPATARVLIADIQRPGIRTLANSQRFTGQSGFQRTKPGNDEALLLARYDGDKNRSVVEIMDLENGLVLHGYAPDIRDLNSRSMIKSELFDLDRDKNLELYTINHPFLTEDGGLVFHGMDTPLAKIDVCSNIVWTIDGFFHHSIERDADGNYWTASVLNPAQLEHLRRDGRDEALVLFSPEGRILFEKSLAKILIENDLKTLVYSGGQYSKDPLHLNDIQPALEDSRFWRRGDLFLSLRNRSVIVLYRPSTNKVLWWRQGPWTSQHDVDIISDQEIAVFDNNMTHLRDSGMVLGFNDTLVYNFLTGKTTAPFSRGYKTNDIRTITEGRSEIRPDGEIFIEEQNYGRLLKMDSVGEISWQYVNRANNGLIYNLHWSRYIDESLAHGVAEIAAEKCSSGP